MRAHSGRRGGAAAAAAAAPACVCVALLHLLLLALLSCPAAAARLVSVLVPARGELLGAAALTCIAVGVDTAGVAAAAAAAAAGVGADGAPAAAALELCVGIGRGVSCGPYAAPPLGVVRYNAALGALRGAGGRAPATVRAWLRDAATAAALPGASDEVDAVMDGAVDAAAAAAGVGPGVVERPCAAQRPRRPRVVDAVMYFDEAELLALRMGELSGVVDVFLVVEATMTFAGRRHTPTFNVSSDAMRPFRDRIVSAVVHDELPAGGGGGDAPWVREGAARNAIADAVARLSPPLAPDDLLIVSDVDEVPTAEAVRHVRDCADAVTPLYLELAMSTHAPRWSAGPWAHSFIVRADEALGPAARPLQDFRQCNECGQYVWCGLPPRYGLRRLGAAGVHLSSYRPPHALAAKIAASPHGVEPAYAAWAPPDTCWSYLAHAALSRALGTGGAREYLSPARVLLPPTLAAQRAWPAPGPVGARSLAAASDALRGLASPLAYAEALAPPRLAAVRAACGEPRAAPVPPDGDADADAGESDGVAGGGDPLAAAAAWVGCRWYGPSRALEAWVAARGLTPGGAGGSGPGGGITVALAVAVARAPVACDRLVALVRGLHAAAATGWGVRSYVLPFGAAAAAAAAGAVGAGGGGGGAGYCAEELARCADIAHGVRVSERVCAAAAAAASTTVPAGGGGGAAAAPTALLEAALQVVYSSDLESGSLDAAVLVLDSSALAEAVACAPPAVAALRGLYRALRRGGLFVAAGFDGDRSAEHAARCVSGEWDVEGHASWVELRDFEAGPTTSLLTLQKR